MTAFMRMHLPIPADMLYIWQVIHDAGHEVLFVGGCVRDMIIGDPVHDYDLATSAQPEQVMALFPDCIPTGIQHGTVTVIHHGRAVEVTTFRTEDHYRDSRRPESVVFVRRVDQDLQRRDFTCNSMAYRPDKGLLDLFDGLGDLKRGCLRTVGSAAARFSEDALRMLRAIRFCSQLNLEPEQSLLVAASIQKDRIFKLSRERIASELSRLFQTRFPERLNSFSGAGLLEIATRALDLPVVSEDLLVKLLLRTLPGKDNPARLPQVLHVPAGILAILICMKSHGRSKTILESADNTKTIRTLQSTLIHEGRFSSSVASESTALLVAIATLLDPGEYTLLHRVRLAAARIHVSCLLSPDQARDRVVHATSLLALLSKDGLCMRDPGPGDFLTIVRQSHTIALEVKNRQDIIAVKELPVRGGDLIRMGVVPSPRLGGLLESLLDEALSSETSIPRERLLAIASDRLVNECVYPGTL